MYRNNIFQYNLFDKPNYSLLKAKRVSQLISSGLSVKDKKTEKRLYIQLLGDASLTKYGDCLLDCMSYYKASNLQELTVSQLKNYWEMIVDGSVKQKIS